LLSLTLFFGWFAVQNKFDTTIESYILKEDLKEYRQFLEQFGTDEIIVIAFGGEDIFTTESLRLIDTISQNLKNLHHVRQVHSLTTAKIIFGEKEWIYFDPLVTEIPSTSEKLLSIRQKSLADPIISSTLISSDARNTAIVVEIEYIPGEFDYKIDLLNQIRTFLKKEEVKTDKNFYVGGAPVLDDAIFRYSKSDQILFFPLMLLITAAIMFIMFLRIEVTVLPVLVVLLTVIWTYGFLFLLGYKINVLSTITGPLLMAVGITDSMHFVTDYLLECAKSQRTKLECIERSFNSLVIPCSMTTLTTVFGLLMLLSADLPPIRQFGLVAGAGVLFAFIISIFILPILLSIFPFPKSSIREKIRRGFFAMLLLRLGHWHKGKAVAVLSISFLGTIAAIFSLAYLKVGTKGLDYFKHNDINRAQTEWIDANIGGSNSLEFFIDAKRENALTRPSLLKKMEHFQNYLIKVDGITGAYSAVDLVKSLNRAFHGGEEREFLIPSSPSEVIQQLFLVEGSDTVMQFLSNDYSKGRVIARVDLNKIQSLSDQIPDILKNMEKIFGNTATITLTGIVYLNNQLERYILSSQIKSFLLAFIVISVTMILFLRSFKLGILAMIPNLMPILFTMALMPILRIPLDIGTVMVAGIALGLVVDDTIHFLSRFRLEIKRTYTVKIAIAHSIAGTGRPVVFTSIVLSVGFFVLVFASLKPITHFGILSSTVILLAMVFDLVVLPAILGFIPFGYTGHLKS
jgi:predicted RND superfamily exporter protein